MLICSSQICIQASVAFAVELLLSNCVPYWLHNAYMVQRYLSLLGIYQVNFHCITLQCLHER